MQRVGGLPVCLGSAQIVAHRCPHTIRTPSNRCNRDGHHDVLNSDDLNHGLLATKLSPGHIKETVLDEIPHIQSSQ